MEKSIVLVGSDPEVFIRDLNTKEPRSIIGRLGGDKWNTMPISSEGHGVLEDNCSAEFNIPPSDNAEDFVKHTRFCMDWINQKMIKEHNSEVFNAASVIFSDEELEDPAAWVFGCEPDYNAYTGKQNPKPHADEPNLRSAGGHVHIGFKKNPTKQAAQKVIRAADIFLGVPSVLLDDDTRRRELYGKPGAFRYKSYGAEYRTLSNFWVFDDNLIKWVFNQVQTLVAYAHNKAVPANDECAARIQEAINTNNRRLASDIIRDFNIVMP